jgi:hypothetical protein
MSDLERRYHVLLLAFPRRYRERRGEEMVGTLMEAAGPEQRWPSPADAADLVDAGLAARTGLSSESAISSVLGLAAPYGLAVAGAIASVCLVFGELKVPGIWHRGFQPNQFTGDRFETNAVPLYGLAVAAFLAMVAGRAGVARVLALAGCIASYVSLNSGSLRGGNFHPPVDLLALLFVALLPTVVAPAVRHSRMGVLGVAAAVLALGAAIAPARTELDSRASFYADTPSTVIRDRGYLAVGLLVVVVALVTLAVSRRRWQIGAAGALLLPPVVALLATRPIPGEFGYHYVEVAAFLEVMVLAVAVVVSRLNRDIVVARRREDT